MQKLSSTCCFVLFFLHFSRPCFLSQDHQVTCLLIYVICASAAVAVVSAGWCCSVRRHFSESVSAVCCLFVQSLLPVPNTDDLPPRLRDLWATSCFSGQYWPVLFSLRALSNCSLAVLDAQAFQDLAQEYDKVGAFRRNQHLHLHHIQIKHIPPHAIWLLTQRCVRSAAHFCLHKQPGTLSSICSPAHIVHPPGLSCELHSLRLYCIACCCLLPLSLMPQTQEKLERSAKHHAAVLNALPQLEQLWSAAAAFDPMKDRPRSLVHSPSRTPHHLADGNADGGVNGDGTGRSEGGVFGFWKGSKQRMNSHRERLKSLGRKARLPTSL